MGRERIAEGAFVPILDRESLTKACRRLPIEMRACLC
jgi:hypothetical protein